MRPSGRSPDPAADGESRLDSVSDSARPKAIVTTSWDDGHCLDSRLADLLAEYELPGTFYISPRDAEFEPNDRLVNSELVKIAQGFEIGAHTMTHPRLTKLANSAAQREIVDSKLYLEDAVGCAVNSFCYPYGLFGSEHVKIVQDAGFRYARTVRRFSRSTGSDQLQAPTTVHAYSHLVDIPQAIALGRFNPMISWNMYANWGRLAEHLFDEVLEKGGVFHLWGHSWEIGKNNDWDTLRRVFDYIAHRSEVTYLVNGQLGSGAVA